MKKETADKIGVALSIITIGYVVVKFIMFPLFAWWDGVVMGLNHLICG